MSTKLASCGVLGGRYTSLRPEFIDRDDVLFRDGQLFNSPSNGITAAGRTLTVTSGKVPTKFSAMP